VASRQNIEYITLPKMIPTTMVVFFSLAGLLHSSPIDNSPRNEESPSSSMTYYGVRRPTVHHFSSLRFCMKESANMIFSALPYANTGLLFLYRWSMGCSEMSTAIHREFKIQFQGKLYPRLSEYSAKKINMLAPCQATDTLEPLAPDSRTLE